MVAWSGLKEQFRKDPVLFISLILALLSMIVVTPSEKYLDYVDVRTLALLFCLMAVVSGISSTGAFTILARELLRGCGSIRAIIAVLTGLPFILSMFITNDVSLITFVPFAIIVLGLAGRKDLVIPVIVIQTLAANLGSTLLPFGNPQNIFIASKYGADIAGFVTTNGPFALLGTVILTALILMIKNGDVENVVEKGDKDIDNTRLACFIVLFAVCILAVIGLIPYLIALIVVVIAVLLLSPGTLFKIDWGLLLTFVFLFVFTGNLASFETISAPLKDMMSGNPVVTSAVVSQFISNVPAAVMLSNFTSDWSGLLAGVSIGGFGTPIASMASIITLRIYSKGEDSDRKAFMKYFLATNFVMLILLLVLAQALSSI